MQKNNRVSQIIDDNSKEIENKKVTSTLLSENKHDRNKENIKHLEKKTKKIGKIRKKELINTRERLDMIKNGLVNVLNHI